MSRIRSQPGPATFGSQVIDFYARLTAPRLGQLGVEALFPYRDPAVREVMGAFYRTYFGDTASRTFIIGINPGRFGGGTTGIPFTDPVSLERQCGITNAFPKRRELSAEFVEKVIDRSGGPRSFYQSFFITAVSPVGFTRNGTNYNYYDDPGLLRVLRPFIVARFRTQLGFGAHRRLAIVLGKGRNFAFFERLNDEEGFFENLVAIEHPRFIMQYRRPYVRRYLANYLSLLQEARSAAL
jgi:Domain of unknown function (DUF4918)